MKTDQSEPWASLTLPSGQTVYRALAAAIQSLVMEGRLATGSRLPAERVLAGLLGISRTTVTSAYRQLVEDGWVSARQGSGTTVTLPITKRLPSLPLVPHTDSDTIDLSTAAGLAPSGTADLVGRALEWLPTALSSAGYEPFGAPYLRERVAAWYAGRGLPTTPEQIIVTAGAVAALSVVFHALVKPGAHVVLDNPTYPGAFGCAQAVRGRPIAVPLDDAGWNIDAWAETLHRLHPSAAYLIPDFHNPTGLVMSQTQRRELAQVLTRAACLAIVDETTAGLGFGDAPPPPLACFCGDAITLGSLSKVLWGGFRIGWVRAPAGLINQLKNQQIQLSFGASVLDQLVAAAYLDDPTAIVTEVTGRMRQARDAWQRELASSLPDWQVPEPDGGIGLWIKLPRPVSAGLALSAARYGVTVIAGGRFSADHTMNNRLRLPLTIPPDIIPEAVHRLTRAWAEADTQPAMVL